MLRQGRKNFPELIGKKFNFLTVKKVLGIDEERKYFLLCKCDCGKDFVARKVKLLSGYTKSCGCIRYKSNWESRYKINELNNCWEWTGTKCDTGYGIILIKNNSKSRQKRIRAHRVFFQKYKGNIPSKMLVCHKCDNPICVNPDHLFLGTNQDNMNDKISKFFGRLRGCRLG